MRQQPPFSCPSCGMESGYPTSCDDCSELMVDPQGRPAILPYMKRRRLPRNLGSAMLLSAFFGSFTALQAWVIEWWDAPLMASGICWILFAHLLGYYVYAHWLSTGDGARSRRARAARDAVGLRPIVEHEDGTCRVQGRVRVLRAATDAGDAVGAAHMRERTSHSYQKQAHHKSGPRTITVTETMITDRAECGRFAIVDDTGVAVVDDDAFAVWGLNKKLPANRDGAFEVLDGAMVEVVGPAKWMAVEDTVALDPHGENRSYRQEPNARSLVFDGDHDHPIWILV